MKQLLKNVIYIALGASIGFSASYFTTKSYHSIIEQAIAKNTSEIKNTFTNEFKKIKNKKGEDISIVIDPSTNNALNHSDTTLEPKKGIIRRLFNR